MKNLLIICSLFASVACKDNRVEPGYQSATVVSTTTGNAPAIFNPAGQTLILSGSFVSAVHYTEGKVSVYSDKDNKQTILVEGFKTDAGPDLRIYLAEDGKASNFVEVSDKVITKGDFTVSLPASINLDKQKSLLIWCKQFSVLFGIAELK